MPLPEPQHWVVGDLSVIMNGEGQPAAVTETISLVEFRSKDVTEEFTLSECEGAWQDSMDGHLEFLNTQRHGPFDEETIVLCERLGIISQRRK
jgi:uncharacterized protein YhfF